MPPNLTASCPVTVEVVQRVPDLVAHHVGCRRRPGADDDLPVAVGPGAGVPGRVPRRERHARQGAHIVQIGNAPGAHVDRVEPGRELLLDQQRKLGQPGDGSHGFRCRGRIGGPLTDQDGLQDAAVPQACRGGPGPRCRVPRQRVGTGCRRGRRCLARRRGRGCGGGVRGTVEAGRGSDRGPGGGRPVPGCGRGAGAAVRPVPVGASASGGTAAASAGVAAGAGAAGAGASGAGAASAGASGTGASGAGAAGTGSCRCRDCRCRDWLHRGRRSRACQHRAGRLVARRRSRRSCDGRRAGLPAALLGVQANEAGRPAAAMSPSRRLARGPARRERLLPGHHLRPRNNRSRMTSTPSVRNLTNEPAEPAAAVRLCPVPHAVRLM